MTTTLDTTTERHSWVPYITIAAGAGYLLKTVLVVVTDDSVTTATAVLYVGSLLLAVAAAIGSGLRARPGRRTLVAVGLTIALLAWIMVLGDALTPLFEQVSDNRFVTEEGQLAVLGLVLVVLGARSSTDV